MAYFSIFTIGIFSLIVLILHFVVIAFLFFFQGIASILFELSKILAKLVAWCEYELMKYTDEPISEKEYRESLDDIDNI